MYNWYAEIYNTQFLRSKINISTHDLVRFKKKKKKKKIKPAQKLSSYLVDVVEPPTDSPPNNNIEDI